MNQANRQSGWHRAPHGTLSKKMTSSTLPYESSVVGEYARLLVILIAIPLLVWFSVFVVKTGSGPLYFVSTLILLVSLFSAAGNPGIRIFVLAAMAINVLARLINPGTTREGAVAMDSTVPAWVLLGCLASCCFFELGAWVNSVSRKTRIKTLSWSLLGIPAAAYVSGFPLFDFLTGVDETSPKRQDPDWSYFNEAGFRTAKFAVFAVFVYVGACVGSFLNVVAHCVPRGERVVLRDSICPQCGNRIARIDNLPLFGYINLGGKCRKCEAPIPIRYLLVELAGALVFGSLFLYELVTGCANVPMMNLRQEGILWIILYPKWVALSIYSFHAFFMSVILVLLLMEWDRQALGTRFALLVSVAFLGWGAIYMPMQPVPVDEHIPGVSLQLTPLLAQLMKLSAGMIFGGLVGRITARVFAINSPAILTFAFSLTGLILGWQGLLQVTTIFAVVATVIYCIPKARYTLWARPTTLLFLAIMIHQPFWKIIADSWRTI